MRRVVTVVMAVIMLAWGEATAQPIDAGLYLCFDHGRLFPEETSEVGSVDTGIDYRVNRYLRGDVIMGYRYEDEAETGSDLGGTSFKRGGEALVGMVTVYTHVAKFGVVSSYVGGGVGFLRGKAEEDTFSQNLGSIEMLTGNARTSLAWQLVMGIDVDIAPNWTVDGSYRYFGLGKTTTSDLLVLGDTGFSGGAAVTSTKTHEARVGIRYQF